MNRLHHAFYGFMRTVIKPWFYFKGYRCTPYTPKSKPYLVLTNHNTDWDFFLFGIVLKPHMYFVASEHIYRKGFVSSIIKTLGGPIPRKKGSASGETVAMIKEALRQGENVCMMAEGNRSFSGETGFISPNTGLLAKESGAGLITMALHGCYFISPRWSKEVRKGPGSCSVVHEYTAEELSEMTVDEINDAIRRDLYVNAYEDQKEAPKAYRAKKPAEHLETALFWCPECNALNALRSEGDELSCTACGSRVRFNPYGYFTKDDGSAPRYATITDWYHGELYYLKNSLPALMKQGKPLFEDSNIRLSRVLTGVGTETLAEGLLRLTPEILEVIPAEGEPCRIPAMQIEKMSVIGTDILLFTAGDSYYQLTALNGTYCALKYAVASRLLQGKDYI